MPKILQDRIIWDEDDWLGGLAPQARNSTYLYGGSGASYQRNVNPFRFLGSICPGYLPESVVNVDNITGIIKAGDAGISGATPYAYLIGGDKVYRLDLSNDTIDNSGITHTISHHATPVGQDIKVFSITNSVTSASSTMAMYSFYDGTDGDVGAYDISSSLGVFYDNFLSTQPTGASVLTTDPHPMILGDDGALYIGNGRTLLKLDGENGTNGTLTTVLTLPRGTVIRSFTKSPDYLIVLASRSNNISGSFYRGNSMAYFWNYTSQNYNYAYDLADNMVTAGFNWNGVVGCFTYGRASNGYGAISTKMKLFSGGKFDQVLEYNSNPPGHGSVEIHDGMILWVFGTSGAQSWIGSYGSPWGNRVKGGFNYWGEGSGANLDAGNTGICSNLGGTKLYVCSGANSSSGLEMFYTNYGPIQTSGSFWQGLSARLNLPSQTIGNIKSIKVHFKGSSSGGRTVSLSLLFNGISSGQTVFNDLAVVSNNQLTQEYFVDTSNIQFKPFHTIRPSLTWSNGSGGTECPIIDKIEVFYDTVKFIQ